jgi:DNA-binding response OmpR family regulator
MAKILVIDDELQARDMMKEMLVRAGHEVEVATDGVNGLRIFRELKPDLVVTDLIMPDKEGIETIIELKSIVSEVKIIAVSGGGRYNPEDSLKMAKDLGADYVFRKPFERKEFVLAVNELLK